MFFEVILSDHKSFKVGILGTVQFRGRRLARAVVQELGIQAWFYKKCFKNSKTRSIKWEKGMNINTKYQ